MSRSRMPRRTVVVGLLVAVTASMLALATPATAAPARSLSVSSTRPIAGERVTVTVNLPGSFARPLRLQAKAKDGRWRAVATKTSDRSANARFAYRVPSRATTSLRVVAPATRHRGVRHPKRTSRVVTVRTQPQSVRIQIPAATSAGAAFRAVVVATPARAGRAVVVQRHAGTRWTTVATARQGAGGQTTATLRTNTSASYRAVVRAGGGAAEVISTTSRISVGPTPTPTPTPTPEPPERCDLGGDGTVAWGRGAGATPDPGVGRVDITTDDALPVTSKDVYSHANMTITSAAGAEQTVGTRLRLRGNSTSWISMKYPYKVKLDSSTSLLEMPASKDWVLLANFYDRSLLRNDTAFEAARHLGLPWVSRMRPVEVWLNGTYYGLYQLGEGIEATASRVDLADGGVLLEADRWADTDPVFTTPRGLQVYVKSTTDEALIETARTRLSRAEDVLYSADYADPDGGYRSCLDVDSFVDGYLLAELTKNIDAGFNNSVWMVLGADGRVAMGPAWDFDHSMGNRVNCDIDEPTGWFIARRWFEEIVPPDVAAEDKCKVSQLSGPDGHWYHRLLTDPAFVARVRERWAEVRDEIAGLPAHVDATAADVAPAATRTFTSRDEGGAGIPLGPTFLEGAGHVFRGSWQAETTALSSWLAARIAWLDEQFGG